MSYSAATALAPSWSGAPLSSPRADGRGDLVDELATYDRALGDAEVASLAAGPEHCRPGAR
jgi:hypothetical protein